jgi:hypothetical protein
MKGPREESEVGPLERSGPLLLSIFSFFKREKKSHISFRHIIRRCVNEIRCIMHACLEKATGGFFGCHAGGGGFTGPPLVVCNLHFNEMTKKKKNNNKISTFLCVCLSFIIYIFPKPPKHFIVCHLLLALNKFGLSSIQSRTCKLKMFAQPFGLIYFEFFSFFWWPVKRIPPPLVGPPMARHQPQQHETITSQEFQIDLMISNSDSKQKRLTS